MPPDMPVPPFRDLVRLYRGICDEYWLDSQHRYQIDGMCRKYAYWLRHLIREVGRSSKVCDLGGGIGFFAVGCARKDMTATVVDDEEDECFAASHAHAEGRARIERETSVAFVRRDLATHGIEFEDGTFDAFTCLDAMEHFHNSPKRLFAQVGRALRPGGVFVLAAPNCNDLHHRVSTLVGRGSWTSMEDWYESEVFRGHVREPSVSDLRYIARDMDFEVRKITGTNFSAYIHPSPTVRKFAPLWDRALRWRPSLCGDIGLVARKRS